MLSILCKTVLDSHPALQSILGILLQPIYVIDHYPHVYLCVDLVDVLTPGATASGKGELDIV